MSKFSRKLASSVRSAIEQAKKDVSSTVPILVSLANMDGKLPSADEVEPMIERVLQRITKASGGSLLNKTVYPNLASVLGEARPEMVQQLSEQPEVASISLGRRPSRPLEPIRPVKIAPTTKKDWAKNSKSSAKA